MGGLRGQMPMTHGRKPEDINPKTGEVGGNPAAWGTF